MNYGETTCPVCSSVYVDPRLLPCTHTFCLECIECFTVDKKPGDQVQCVVCSEEFTVSGNGLEDLPKNSFVAKLSQKRHLSSPENANDAKCSQSKSTRSVSSIARTTTKGVISHPVCIRGTSSCKDAGICRSISAQSCPATLNNCTVLTGRQSAGSCVVHSNKNVELYCHDCSTAICVMCYIETHSSHRCSDISKVAEHFRRQMFDDVNSIARGVDRCLEAQQILVKNRREYAERAAQIRTEITNRAELLRQKIDRDREEMLSRLSLVEKDYDKFFESVSNAVERQVTQMASYEKYVAQLSERGAPSEVVKEAPDLHRKAAELTRIDVVDNALKCSLVHNEFRFVSSDLPTSILGEITHENKLTGWTEAPPSIAPIILRHVILKGSGQPIYAITTLRDSVYIARFQSTHIEVYNASNLNFERSFSLVTPGADPRGLVACPFNNCLYVSDHVNYCVHRIELGGKISFTQWSTVSEPAGLSINNVNNLLVTLCRANRVKEYATHGQLVRVFHLHPTIGNPWHCVQLPASEEFVVSHSFPVRGVSILGSDRKLIRRINNYVDVKGDGTSQMNTPRGLAVVGRNGPVLIADYKRILVLDRTLPYVRELPTSVLSSLKQPYALSFDESRDRLYVVERSRGRVMVFDNVCIPPQSLSTFTASSSLESEGKEKENFSCAV